MNHRLALVALATVVASACSASPTAPSGGSTSVVTSTPPTGVAPQPGQRYQICVSVPSTTVAGMTTVSGIVFVRDDGARLLDGCGSGSGCNGGTVGPEGWMGEWGKGHVVNVEILVADVSISDVIGKRCLFGPTSDPFDVRRELAQYIISKDLEWRF